jgi:hypothetical protein
VRSNAHDRPPIQSVLRSTLCSYYTIG